MFFVVFFVFCFLFFCFLFFCFLFLFFCFLFLFFFVFCFCLFFVSFCRWLILSPQRRDPLCYKLLMICKSNVLFEMIAEMALYISILLWCSLRNNLKEKIVQIKFRWPFLFVCCIFKFLLCMNCVEFCTVQETVSSISAFLCDADAQFVIQLISLNMRGLFLGCHLVHMVVYKYMGGNIFNKKKRTNRIFFLSVC